MGFYLTFGFNFIDFVKLSFLLEVKTAILFRTWIKEMHIFCKSWVIKPSHGIKQTKLIITTKKLKENTKEKLQFVTTILSGLMSKCWT